MTKPEDMTNAQLLDKYVAELAGDFTDTDDRDAYRAELLRRLGAAGSASPLVEVKFICPDKAPDRYAVLVNGQEISGFDFEHEANEVADKLRAAFPTGTASPQGDLLTTDELLVILMEECAEVIQAASKCLRFGYQREQPEYGQNDKVLAGEIGDTLGIVDALPLDGPLIEYCRKRKLEKAQKAKAQYGK